MAFALNSIGVRWMKVRSDNIVFRRDVRLNSEDRFERGSPVVRARWAVISVVVCFLAVFVWLPAFAWNLLILLVGALLTYPLSHYRAHRSMCRDRDSGTLEQLCLTSLAPEEIYEGKILGRMAPLIEWRRLLLLALAGHCLLSILFLSDPGVPVVSMEAGLGLYVLAAAGIKLGTLGGVNAGSRGERALKSLFTRREYWPASVLYWPTLLHGVASFVCMVLLYTGVMYILDDLMHVGPPWRELLKHVPALAFLMPIGMAASELDRLFRELHEKDKKSFGRILTLEGRA